MILWELEGAVFIAAEAGCDGRVLRCATVTE